MTIDRDVVEALRYFQKQTSADIQMIRVADEYAFSMASPGVPPMIGMIEARDLPAFMEQWSTYAINITSCRNSNGEHVLPDIALMEKERELDY